MAAQLWQIAWLDPVAPDRELHLTLWVWRLPGEAACEWHARLDRHVDGDRYMVALVKKPMGYQGFLDTRDVMRAWASEHGGPRTLLEQAHPRNLLRDTDTIPPDLLAMALARLAVDDPTRGEHFRELIGGGECAGAFSFRV